MVPGKTVIDTPGKDGGRGLRWEILVSLGLIMFSGVLFMGLTALKSAERAVVLQEVESLDRIVRSIQLTLSIRLNEGSTVRGRSVDLQEVISRTAVAVGLTGFKVVDSSGHVIASLRDEERGSATSDPILLKALEKGTMVRQNEVTGELPKEPRGSWVIAAPVFKRGAKVGAFTITYPLEDMAILLRFQRKIVFTFALIDGVFIVLFGGWFIGRVAVTPLLKISRGAQALAAGDYSTRVRIKGPKEVEALAASFNEMADRIQEEVLKQEEHRVALESTNRELRQAQKEIIRVEKMASVGQLAAGIAHEIGNPLAAVLGYAAILLKETEDPEATQYLVHIEHETTRIQRIISGLLEFSRPKEITVQTLDISSLIRETVDLVTPQRIFRQISVEMELGEGSLEVSGDRHQLQQGLVNLFINAAQAMDGQGTLRIAAESRPLSEGEGGVPRRRTTDHYKRRATDPENVDFAAVRNHFPDLPELRKGDPVVAVTISDTGPGIPQEILGRVFDPFFTTKATGEGTGLGLSITYGIIEAHGGTLWAGNGDEGGAVFTILLPEKRQNSGARSQEPEGEGTSSV